MSITPTGSPAWVRTNSHVEYGGNLNKTNYLSRGVIDALTDVGAEEICRIAADLEACARTCAFAAITYLCNDSSPAAPTIEVVDMMTGVRVISYAGDAAPSGYPSADRNGTGDVTFTFASTYSDSYAVSGGFTPQHAIATLHGSSAGEGVVAISGQTVRVRAFNGGATIADPRLTLVVS